MRSMEGRGAAGKLKRLRHCLCSRRWLLRVSQRRGTRTVTAGDPAENAEHDQRGGDAPSRQCYIKDVETLGPFLHHFLVLTGFQCR